ncbi:MAG: Bug family tripartite tricarboxylate transporter substrate binding protein [Burkholderiales bacterium]
MDGRNQIIAMACAAALFMSASIAVNAQAYPTKPIKIISTIPLGGSGDVAMRMAGAKMSESMGQPILIETNGAAGGLVGARTIIKSPPDGYTLLHSSSGALASSVYLSKDLGYDPTKDFTHISLVSFAPSLLVVNVNVPANSVKELADHAKRNPGKLSYGSNGVGSFFHMAGQTFTTAAGIDALHIPYTGGNMALPLNDLLSGRLDIFFPTIALAGGNLTGGKMRVLAVFSDKRVNQLPNVSAIGEALPGYQPPPSWFAMVGPVGLPQPIVGRIHAEIVKGITDKTVAGRLNDIGVVGVAGTPEALSATIRDSIAATGKIVKELNIQPQ